MVQQEVEDSPPELESQSFDTIPPRPPTPPKESPRAAGAFKGPADEALAAAANGTVTIPAASSPREISPPTSSAESPSRSPSKRSVKWSPWTTYHKPDNILATPTSKRIPPSASTDPKSLKSILKPFSPFPPSPSPANDHPLAAHTHASFTSMLESVVQALSSSERSTKLDTYITFCNTLKAYDEVPDVMAMEAKMPAFLAFLKRDMQARLEDGGNPDSQLIQQAIKLLTILCWTPRLVNCIDDQSATYFVQHAIEKIEDPMTSKYSINLYLHYIAQQKFPMKIMTTDRCNRIISTLENLDQRVTGKSISKERIDVYHRLLVISKPTMLARVNDWMDHAFGALLSGVKEVRNRALIFMGEVAKTMGGEKKVGQAITKIFSRPAPKGKMFEQIRQRLEHFVRADQEGIYVARMWAVVLLLVQGRDHWEFFNPWLRVIESCFNVSEKDVKVEAQMAWSKLIYTMDIGPGTTKKLLHLMCKPLEQYLDPKYNISNTKKPRKAAMVNVAVLLYYGFRPNSPPKQLSDIWEVVVVGLIERLALASREEVTDGCNFLCSMLDGTTHKLWSEQRALNPHTIKADEIPRLDPKWVRSNCELVLKTVQVALWRTSWKNEENVPGARLLWRRFVRTLADAGSIEIKISAEQMESISHLFNMFQRVWNTGPSILDDLPQKDSLSFIQMFSFLVTTSLEALGTLCFTEKLLSCDEHAKFAVASTPSHKLSSESNNAVRYPPILHIFRLLMHPPDGIMINEEYIECAKGILAKCTTTLDSRRKKLQLLASCETLLPRKTPQRVEVGLWTVLADLTRQSLPLQPIQKSLMSPSPVGGEFKDSVSVLKWATAQDVPGWSELFEDLSTIVQTEMGETYLSLHVIEPLAESLRFCKQDTQIKLLVERAAALFEKAYYTKPRPRVENTLKTHFGIAERRPTTNESFENLFALGDDLLKRTYDPSIDQDTKTAAIKLLTAIENFVVRSPQGTIAPLKQMQDGLGIWVKDDAQLLPAKNGMRGAAATNLWGKLLRALDALPRHDSLALSNVCALIASGLESRRKCTVNATIKSWNATYGKSESLTYPRRIRNALRRLRTVADISLPTFPAESDDDGILTPPEFEDTQQELETHDPKIDCIFASPTPAKRYSSVERTTPSSAVKETPYTMKGRRRSMTPAKRGTPVQKLKHMDSQLDFAVIESSPTEGLDSQVATENQKETRERQQLDVNMYPALAITTPTRKPRRASGQPRMDSTPDYPIGTPQLRGPNVSIMIPETHLKPKKSNEELVSFISESSMAQSPRPNSILTSLPPNIPNNNHSNDVDQMMLDQPSSPTKVPETPNITTSPPTSSPSASEFVDAPDIPQPDTHYDIDGDISPLKDISEIAIAISPRKESIDRASYESYTSPIPLLYPKNSPDAQILAEASSATSTPVRKRRPTVGGRKRKRVSSAQKPKHDTPEILDAIVVANDDTEMSPVRPRNEDAAPPSKKARQPTRTSTPRTNTRSSARTRGAIAEVAQTPLVARSQTPQPELEHPVSTPAKRTRSSLTRSLDTSFVAETQPSESSQVPPAVHPRVESILQTPTAVHAPEAPVETKPQKAARMLREALEMLESLDVVDEPTGPEVVAKSDMRELEDEVFDAFARLRRRRRQTDSATPASAVKREGASENMLHVTALDKGRRKSAAAVGL